MSAPTVRRSRIPDIAAILSAVSVPKRARISSYILQIHECERAGRTKVKVSKWIDTEDLPRYTKYINDWHKFQKDMQRNLIEYMRAGEDETARNQTMLVLQVMYVGMYDAEKDFYDQFDARLAHIRSLLCMTE